MDALVIGEGARGRGMPTRTWFDDIAEWMGIGITTCEREAEDRQKWRKIVKSSKVPERPTKANDYFSTFCSVLLHRHYFPFEQTRV